MAIPDPEKPFPQFPAVATATTPSTPLSSAPSSLHNKDETHSLDDSHPPPPPAPLSEKDDLDLERGDLNNGDHDGSHDGGNDRSPHVPNATPPTDHPPPPSTPENPSVDGYVDFDGPTDRENPKNWPRHRRVAATATTALMTFVVTFASSVFSAAIVPVAEEFGVGETVATLGVSLFLLGFVFGPVIFGPASEVWGRRAPLLAGYAVFAIFQIPVAVAKDIATVLVFRFLGGFAACAPLAILGGVVSDLWADPVDRAYAICALAFAAFTGPVAGPIVGGFVIQPSSHLSWRWTAWLTLIAAGAFGGLGFWTLPETSTARILQIKAKRLRKATGDERHKAKADDNVVTIHTIFSVYLVRPWKMVAHEPILALLTAYMSFVYGVLYLLFEAFPYSFHDQRGWGLGVSALPFCSFIVGTALGCGLMAYSASTSVKRAYLKHGVCIPEARLPPMMLGAVLLPIGFFWVLSVSLIGWGEVTTFWLGMAYMIDCYGFYSNSAIAVNTFIRSIAGAAFPLFATYMYRGMGVPWASSLLGFLSLLFVPAPFLFYKYGAKIRARSKWVPTG